MGRNRRKGSRYLKKSTCGPFVVTEARPITRSEGTPSTLHRLPGSWAECYEAWPFQAVPPHKNFSQIFPSIAFQLRINRPSSAFSLHTQTLRPVTVSLLISGLPKIDLDNLPNFGPPRDHALVHCSPSELPVFPGKGPAYPGCQSGTKCHCHFQTAGTAAALRQILHPDWRQPNLSLRPPRTVSLIGHFYPSSGTDISLRAYLHRQPYLFNWR